MHYGRSGKPRYHSVFHRHDGRGQKKSTTKDINWSFRMSSTCRTGHIRTIRNGKDAAAIQAAGQDRFPTVRMWYKKMQISMPCNSQQGFEGRHCHHAHRGSGDHGAV